MSDSIYTAGSGAIVQQMRLDLLANNMANINSPGYKADMALFRSHLADAQSGSAFAIAPNQHVDFDGSRIDMSPGAVKATGNALDLAIDGPGFFQVSTDEGIRYTRGGNFTRNSQGVLVTQNGDPVLGDGGEIVLEQGRVNIDAQGQIEVDGKVVGRLGLVDFPEPNSLEKTGANLFAAKSGALGENTGAGTSIRQGYLETSNVNPVLTMTEMVDVLRTYEAYEKMIRSVRDADSKAINDVGRPG